MSDPDVKANETEGSKVSSESGAGESWLAEQVRLITLEGA